MSFSFLLAGVPPISATAGQQAFACSCGLDDIVYEIVDAETLAGRLDEVLKTPGRLALAARSMLALGQERSNWETESRVLIVASVLSNQDDKAQASA